MAKRLTYVIYILIYTNLYHLYIHIDIMYMVVAAVDETDETLWMRLKGITPEKGDLATFGGCQYRRPHSNVSLQEFYKLCLESILRNSFTAGQWIPTL